MQLLRYVGGRKEVGFRLFNDLLLYFDEVVRQIPVERIAGRAELCAVSADIPM